MCMLYFKQVYPLYYALLTPPFSNRVWWIHAVFVYTYICNILQCSSSPSTLSFPFPTLTDLPYPHPPDYPHFTLKSQCVVGSFQMRSACQSFFLWITPLMLCLKSLASPTFSHVLSSWSFIFLHFIFGCMVHFELIFCEGDNVCVYIHFFCMWMSSFYRTTCWKIFLYSISFSTLSISWLHYCECITRLSVLFIRSICLFFYYQYTALITVASQ
jgi:hypothetical protein